jgi:hypothetical protein
MNTDKNRVQTRFAPETRFEVRPAPPAPFRAVQDTEFEKLKERLLVSQLELVQDPALNAPLRRAANEAAALAWIHFCPLLVYPLLFEEKARLALRQAKRQARILSINRELLAA